MDTKSSARDQIGIADLCDLLAIAAQNLHTQLPSRGDELYRYYYGTLVRQRTFLGDIASILRIQSIQHLSSAFVLFRVLLDDTIRLVTVWASADPIEVLHQLDADATNHRVQAMLLRVRYSEKYIPDQNFTAKMRSAYETIIHDLKTDSSRANLFKDQAKAKYKYLPSISQALRITNPRNGWNIDALSELNVLYKELSTHVHYSPIVFNEDRDSERRQKEIAHFETVLVYLYKALWIRFEYFQNRLPATSWENPELDAWFENAVEYR